MKAGMENWKLPSTNMEVRRSLQSVHPSTSIAIPSSYLGRMIDLTFETVSQNPRSRQVLIRPPTGIPQNMDFIKPKKRQSSGYRP